MHENVNGIVRFHFIPARRVQIGSIRTAAEIRPCKSGTNDTTMPAPLNMATCKDSQTGTWINQGCAESTSRRIETICASVKQRFFKSESPCWALRPETHNSRRPGLGLTRHQRPLGTHHSEVSIQRGADRLDPQGARRRRDGRRTRPTSRHAPEHHKCLEGRVRRSRPMIKVRSSMLSRFISGSCDAVLACSG